MTDEPLPCFIHDVVEPAHPDDDSSWCMECWHTYADDWILIAEYNWGLIEMGHLPRSKPADEIFFCPLCLHDF